MRFIFQSTKRKLALDDTFPSSLQSLEKYQIRDFVQMPTWTLTAAINNRDIWRKCLHAQKEDSSWKPRKSPGSLNRGFFFFSSVAYFSAPNTWAVPLHALCICEQARHSSGNWRIPISQAVLGSQGCQNHQSQSLSSLCASTDPQRETREKAKYHSGSPTWANTEGDTEKRGANSMGRENQALTERGCFSQVLKDE